MSQQERSELMASFYQLQGQLFGMRAKCQASFSLVLGTKVERALDAVNEALAEFNPDVPAASEMQFPRRKF